MSSSSIAVASLVIQMMIPFPCPHRAQTVETDGQTACHGQEKKEKRKKKKAADVGTIVGDFRATLYCVAKAGVGGRQAKTAGVVSASQ